MSGSRNARAKRKNRLWLPQNAGIQATFVLCEECGEGYEASLEHICRRQNSYPGNCPGTMDCVSCGGRKTVRYATNGSSGHKRGCCTKCGMRFIE